MNNERTGERNENKGSEIKKEKRRKKQKGPANAKLVQVKSTVFPVEPQNLVKTYHTFQKTLEREFHHNQTLHLTLMIKILSKESV